jgi:NADH-quinone oxidoreductase subunit M
MILIWLIAVPSIGALLAVASGRGRELQCRRVTVAAFAINLLLTLLIWASYASSVRVTGGGAWLFEFDREWIPSLGIRFHLAIDGLSLVLVALTNFLGLMAVGASWRGITDRIRFFHANLLWMGAAVIGVFLSLDLFLFYFFWELMLVPLYFLIGIWGHERRFYAALKFFIFTQSASLVMLLAIIGLYFIHGRGTGVYTFDYEALLGTPLARGTAVWLMLGFFIAFVVKMAAVPLHNWLPDAHTQAPTAGSVVLAGLVLKVGAYGLIRFAVPLFPGASAWFAPVAMIMGVAGILYGAVLAFAQTDIKRLVAYTSISHMGFVLLGVYTGSMVALQGAVMVMVAHGVSISALFILVGALSERIKTREMGRMGGLWAAVPRMSGTFLVFALASLGLPGFGNFVGEFLVLLGVFRTSVPVAAVAAFSLVTAAVYSLWMFQRACHGPNSENWSIPDLTVRETTLAACMISVTLWLGLYPGAILAVTRPALESLHPGEQAARTSGTGVSGMKVERFAEERGGRE